MILCVRLATKKVIQQQSSCTMITNLKRFWCTGKSVINVDKTFYLGSIHVTITVFKNRSVLNPKTKDNPIFLGPIFLYNSSNFGKFAEFFVHLENLLGVDSEKLSFGMNGEAALHKAIKYAFPSSIHILCCNHLKENLRAYLTNKIGANIKTRKKLINIIFDILEAKDEVDYAERVKKVEEKCSNICPEILPYLKSRFLSCLKVKVWDHQNLDAVGKMWTNNNAESFNHVIKSKFQWKQKKIVDLIKGLESLVN